jgi:hypothetical protein
MSIDLAHTFATAARECANEGDTQGAIAGMQSLLCIRDLPKGYRQDAETIMELLLLDFFAPAKVKP